MTDLKLKYGESANLPEQQDGSLLFTTDKKEIYLDTPDGRYQMSGNNNSITYRKVLSEAQSTIDYSVTQPTKLVKLNINFDLINTTNSTNNILGIKVKTAASNPDLNADSPNSPTKNEHIPNIQFGEEGIDKIDSFFGTVSITPMSDLLTIEYNINNKIIGVRKISCPLLIEGILLYNINTENNFDSSSTIRIEEIIQTENSLMESYLQNGKRTDFYSAFAGKYWDNKSFKPNCELKPKGSASYMFAKCGLKNFDFEAENITIDFSECTVLTYTFREADITKIKIFDCSNPEIKSLNRTFYQSKIETIEIFKVHQSLKYTSTFDGASNLKNIKIDGIIGQNGFSVSGSPLLTEESLLSILEALEDKTGDTSEVWTITIGSTNKQKLSSTKIQEAENKGWIVN